MANCKRFGHKVTNLCGTPAGVKEIYFANYNELLSYTLDNTETILSGITTIWKPKTWYLIKVLKNTSLFITEGLINIPNGVAQSIPKLEFKISGLDEVVLNIYNQLKQVTCIAVVRTLDDKLYALGFQNGLDTTECNIGTTENRIDGFKGAQFTMKGIEKDPMYLLDPDGIGLCFPNCNVDCNILVDVSTTLDFLTGYPIQYANCN